MPTTSPFGPGLKLTLVLLVLAALLNPGGLVGRGGDHQERTPFYLASPLVGSGYVGGIREGRTPAAIQGLGAIVAGEIGPAIVFLERDT